MATRSHPTALALTVPQTAHDLMAASSALLRPGRRTLSTTAPRRTIQRLRLQHSLPPLKMDRPVRQLLDLLLVMLQVSVWKVTALPPSAPRGVVSGRRSLPSRSKPMKKTVLVSTTSSTAVHPCHHGRSSAALLRIRDVVRSAALTNLAELKRLRQRPIATTLQRPLTTFRTTAWPERPFPRCRPRLRLRRKRHSPL